MNLRKLRIAKLKTDGPPPSFLPSAIEDTAGAEAGGGGYAYEDLKPLVALPQTKYRLDKAMSFMSNASTVALTAGTITCWPLILGRRTKINECEINIAGAGATLAQIEIGLYNSVSTATHCAYPGSRVVQFSTIDSHTLTGSVMPSSVTGPVTLDPGVYWLAIFSKAAAATVANFNPQYTTPLYGVHGANVSWALAWASLATDYTMPSTMPFTAQFVTSTWPRPMINTLEEAP